MGKSKFCAIILTGPTASGKSALAIRLAKEIDGEIISADSRQIFRGLNIGSGKVAGVFDMEKKVFLSEKIPHHLIDIADPMQDFNVSHFLKSATAAIEEISGRGKIPIICGGSVFWINSLAEGVKLPQVPPNPKLRAELSSQTAADLFKTLQKLDLRRAAAIDNRNKVRLVRAIEIATALGEVPKPLKTNRSTNATFLKLALDIPKEQLQAKIRKRVSCWLKEGLIEETQSLLAKGVSAEWLKGIGLEYRQTVFYLEGKLSLLELQEKIYYDNIHYAKRQLTWLRKEKELLWIKNYPEALSAATNFLAHNKKAP
ncbi:MAG TPA: tRNA (adenosine(37)-N6)-dimethylallyltransferase MiaA [Candidatus Moranbacteria bacterium]|nr:tRNA (adenosine(37)-N6)-dimethylallyltransferase MiaA [Candidatus Moranbacteria bacterium]